MAIIHVTATTTVTVSHGVDKGVRNPWLVDGVVGDLPFRVLPIWAHCHATRGSFASLMPESLTSQAEAAVGDVAEGVCPLCVVGLVIHDCRACCPCSGDSYRAEPNCLEIEKCA